MFPKKELFLQTHTNLSLPKRRLETFLKKVNKIKEPNHIINICNSYHIDKQPVELYIQKMDICNRYNSLGYCFFSTEIPKKEKMLKELYSIIKKYPKKLIMKFTEIENLALRSIKGYEELKKDIVKMWLSLNNPEEGYEIMNTVPEKYRTLVIDNTKTSSNIEDYVFHKTFKEKSIPPNFRFFRNYF